MLLFDSETDTTLVVDDVLSFVDQIATHVHRPEQLVSEDAKFID